MSEVPPFYYTEFGYRGAEEVARLLEEIKVLKERIKKLEERNN